MTDTAEKPRRRVRTANAALSRVQLQRHRLASTYAAASSAQERFNAAATALRAAAAERLHRDSPAAARRVEALTSQIMQLVSELHTQQERSAQRVLRAEDRRHARNERNRDEHARTE